MARRIHVRTLLPGLVQLDPSQAHHLRDVLRLKLGATVEIFDDAGHVAQSVVTRCDDQVMVRVDEIQTELPRGQIVVASAVPQGDRADWMVEKLSELGVARFIPLKTARSVVHPTGPAKRERWQRLATESAKQSHRSGVMKIDDLTHLNDLLTQIPQACGIFLSTEPDSPSMLANSSFILHPSSFLLIGPEGGWTDGEIARFRSAGFVAAKLTNTILRVETAAVAAAAIVMAMREAQP